jgi:hypothetical protein
MGMHIITQILASRQHMEQNDVPAHNLPVSAKKNRVYRDCGYMRGGGGQYVLQQFLFKIRIRS